MWRMSDQGKSGKIFEEKHTDYLIQWHMKPDHVLATELNSLFDVPFKTEDVERQRAELKLPAPDPEKSIAAAIRPSKRAEEPSAQKSDKPLSAAQVMKDSKPKKPVANIKDNFHGVSDEVQGRLDKLLEEKRASSDFVFKPVFVTKPQKGGIYVYPGIGPVVCGGVETIPVAGIEMKTVSFTEVHATGAKRIVRFDPAKIEQKFVRELATPESLDSILYKLSNAKTSLTGLPKHATQQKVFFENIMASPNLADVTGLLCHAFKNDKDIGKRGSLEVTFGNLSLDMIAAEYAVVKDVPINDAKDLIKRVVRKPTIAQLTEYNDGRMRDGPA